MRIGVYVGSFNPVHKGHISIINHLLHKNYLDKIIVIPTGNYWNKNNLIDIKHRINMLKFYESDQIIINNTLNNKEFTYEILEEVKKEYENESIYLIIGADNLLKFHLWKNIDDLLQYKILVINREDVNVKDIIEKFKNKNNFIIIDDFEKINISSTKIREDMEDSIDDLDYFIYDYIKSNKLYDI